MKNQEKSESIGKDKIGSSSTVTLNIILDNDAAKLSASEAIVSDFKKRKLEFPEPSSSKDTLGQLQSFINKRGVDLVPTMASALPPDHTLRDLFSKGYVSVGLWLGVA